MKAGLRVRITSDPAHLDEHVRLIDSSMQRREAKGENVPVGASSEELRPYLESGFCRIFQAILGEETVSSMMVAHASTGAYLYTSGTSPTGMKMGASHFLVHEIAQTCQRQGAHVFNLGGVRDVNSGLGQYKRYFGAEMVNLEAAEFYVGSIWQKAISGGAQRMHGIVQKALRGVR
jgi:lipid II:glycine glycyltransferase (peptidoglycan interpeptide bridge formation enzyme)